MLLREIAVVDPWHFSPKLGESYHQSWLTRGLKYSHAGPVGNAWNIKKKRGKRLIRGNVTRKESDKEEKNASVFISPRERSIRSWKVIDLATSLLTRCISILSACLRKLVSILAVADTDERRGGRRTRREIARGLLSNGDSKINHLVMPNERIRRGRLLFP